MKRLHSQSGSSLITLVGVIAALAIMGATLVALTANVQSNTFNDRMKAKSSAVTEAALDVGMYELSADWPEADGTGPVWNTAAQNAFRAKFVTSEFPNPKTGPYSSVTFFDNAPYTGNDPGGTPYSATNPPDWDKNMDKRMWIVAQAGVGPAKTRIQALVEITHFDAAIPTGIAVFTGANLLSNGGGNNPKITVEVPPTGGGTVGVLAVGNPVGNPNTIDDTTVYDQSTMYSKIGEEAGTVDAVMPPSVIEGLITMAKNHGRYFSGATAIDDAQNSTANGTWSDGGVTGLTVIEPSTPGTLTIKDDYNSVAKPGIILLLGGSNLDFGGGGNFWGVLYTQGTVDKGHGNFIVHGMLVCDSNLDMRGTVDVKYNNDAIVNLWTRFPANVQIVPNSWRELQPQ
jgi:hypothetical protein